MNKKVLPRRERYLVLAFVLIPLLAVPVGVIQVWGWGADWISISLFILFFWITTRGITVGFHRCFTHVGFVFRHNWIKGLVAIAGSMSAEGSLFTWVGWHLIHHSHTDREGDPHSPYEYGNGFWNLCKGFYHAHVGWLFITPAPLQSIPLHLKDDNTLGFVDRTFFLWVILGLVLPMFIGALIRGSFAHAHIDFLWGGLIRLCVAHHVTWCINSVCHIWGERPFDIDDMSTNNRLIAFLSGGEGWHHAHHTFPKSAKHGLLRAQFDESYLIIALLRLVGLVKNVHVPTNEAIERRLK